MIRGGVSGQGTSQSQEEQEGSYKNPVGITPPPPPVDNFWFQDNLDEPTGHLLETQSKVKGWENVRFGILRAVTEECLLTRCNLVVWE